MLCQNFNDQFTFLQIGNGPMQVETNEDLHEELSDMQFKLDQRDRDIEKVNFPCFLFLLAYVKK